MFEDNEEEFELYGIRPGVIAFVMILFSLIVALGILPLSILFQCLIFDRYSESIFFDDYLWFIYNPALLIPLNILNVIYIRQMVHHYRGNCTRDHVIWVGLICIILPTIYAMLLIRFLPSVQALLAISPIYLPFIFGIILMQKKPPPELISPWQGDLIDGSWWTRQRPEWLNRMFSLKDTEDNDS